MVFSALFRSTITRFHGDVGAPGPQLGMTSKDASHEHAKWSGFLFWWVKLGRTQKRVVDHAKGSWTILGSLPEKVAAACFWLQFGCILCLGTETPFWPPNGPMMPPKTTCEVNVCPKWPLRFSSRFSEVSLNCCGLNLAPLLAPQWGPPGPQGRMFAPNMVFCWMVLLPKPVRHPIPAHPG